MTLITEQEPGEQLDDMVAIEVMGWHVSINRHTVHWVDQDDRYMCGVGKYDGFEDG